MLFSPIDWDGSVAKRVGEANDESKYNPRNSRRG
jgi:hypothetical protein